MDNSLTCPCGCKHIHTIVTPFNTYFVRCSFCGLRTQGEYLDAKSAIKGWKSERRV